MNPETLKALRDLEGQLMRARYAKAKEGEPLPPKERFVQYWTMQSIKVTHDLEYVHWRELRKGDYFEEKDMIQGEIAKIKFTIKRVLEYKRQKGW